MRFLHTIDFYITPTDHVGRNSCFPPAKVIVPFRESEHEPWMDASLKSAASALPPAANARIPALRAAEAINILIALLLSSAAKCSDDSASPHDKANDKQLYYSSRIL